MHSGGIGINSWTRPYLANALGQTVQASDRNGNVHQYTLDVLGRLTSDAVTTLGAGVDGSVRRIEYGYDQQDNLSLITSYDAATGGNVVNQVQRTFNGLGQLTNEYQSHSGAVVQGTTPQVQYGYTEMSGGQNNSRLTSMTYPSGYVLNYNYNTGLDSNISRLSSLSDASNTLESYKYLGLATVVERDHPQNNVNLSYIEQGSDPNANHDGGDQYTGLDRFGRVIDQNWVNATTGTSTDRFQYGYSQDSDVLYRQNLVDSAMSELYSYDNLHQLVNFQRGTLNATHDGIVGSPSHSQSWTPDALGNFTSITTDGTTDTRTANQQNEYTSSTKLGTQSYDANGNLTADGSGNTYVYDAWNRLVAVKNNGSTVAGYGYDGVGRRITETHGSTTTDLYLSAAGQVLEERGGGVVQARNVWSPVYLNALVLRDQSSQHNGVLDQRLYVQQDANWNVTALVDASGNVVERYNYDPYGAVRFLNPDFTVRGSSSYAMPYLWQGERYDATVGLYHVGYRDVSPTLMRPLQTDPLGLEPDNNYYRWEGNQPTGTIDPSGLFGWGDVKQVGWWVLDNSVGVTNSLANKVAFTPDVYGAFRHDNYWRLIPLSTWYFDFYEGPKNTYAAYKAQWMSNDDAMAFTIMRHTPILSSVMGTAEMIARHSARPGEVGKELTAWDYFTRGHDICRDVHNAVGSYALWTSMPANVRPQNIGAPVQGAGPTRTVYTLGNVPVDVNRLPQAVPAKSARDPGTGLWWNLRGRAKSVDDDPAGVPHLRFKQLAG